MDICIILNERFIVLFRNIKFVLQGSCKSVRKRLKRSQTSFYCRDSLLESYHRAPGQKYKHPVCDLLPLDNIIFYFEFDSVTFLSIA